MPLFVLTLLLFALSLTWSNPTNPNHKAPLSIVFWIGGHSHDFASSTNILKEVLPNYFDAKISIHKNADFLNPNAVKRPNVIVMYHCIKLSKGNLSNIQKNCLLEWVKDGIGVVALHSSYYSFVK